MPNWCTNRLLIVPDGVAGKSQLRDLWSRLEPNIVTGSEKPWDDQLHLLDTFVPMPEKYEGTVEGSESRPADDGLTWYAWQRKNWGTKWGDCEGSVLERTDDRLVLQFETPWGPPEPGLVRVQDLFPDLVFVCGWYGEASDEDQGQFWIPEDVDPDEVDPDGITLVETREETDEDGDDDYTYTVMFFPEFPAET